MLVCLLSRSKSKDLIINTPKGRFSPWMFVSVLSGLTNSTASYYYLTTIIKASIEGKSFYLRLIESKAKLKTT